MKHTKNPFRSPYEVTSQHILITAGMFAIGLLFLFAIVYFSPKPYEIQYDCKLAEISPDYPQSVKEQCRKMLQNTKNRT
jgi:cytochrome c oxidase assembly factor CtaG